MGNPIEFQLQAENKLYLIIESCYQGPEELDPNQPTEQEIEKMIKDWQNENKKNKNPPPMPDFRQPRKIKPGLVLVTQESARIIEVRLAKIDGAELGPLMKVDYRSDMKKKREENEIAKAEAAKKAEEEGNKKGGKAPQKGEIELKVNVFCENPKEKEKILQIENASGKAEIERLEFPDDFPPGSYYLIMSSPFKMFGEVKQVRKTINIKAKNAGGKKK